ncbi:MBL fold metallo-hydrolase [Bernardetia sp. Wsw4-3y2]|uniref:MBL fold metallo-hydrolase n=1 Tax=Bernardetia sp. Wsw4-3y2 TaxID=3127471 RepID=UPI0030CB297E
MPKINRIFNPDLEFIIDRENEFENYYEGNPLLNGVFCNEGATQNEETSLATVLKWQLQTNPQKQEKKKENFKLETIQNNSFFEENKDCIVWLGHACFFIRLNGINFLTDLCLESMPFVPRKSSLPCQISEIKNIDYLLLSHNHRDHLDIPSLKKLLPQNPNMEFLVPLETADFLHRQVSKDLKIQEAGWYQQFKTKEKIKVNFLPSKHWCRRGLFDFNEMLWGGFWLETGLEKTNTNHKLFFVGDTAYAPHFKRIEKNLGAADTVIMPIGAYKPPFMMQNAHINPEEAVKAFQETKGKTLIPMHYGTFDLADEPLGEPIKWLISEMEKQGLSEKLNAPKIGEVVYL